MMYVVLSIVLFGTIIIIFSHFWKKKIYIKIKKIIFYLFFHNLYVFRWIRFRKIIVLIDVLGLTWIKH